MNTNDPSNNNLLGLMTIALSLWPKDKQQAFLSRLSPDDNETMERVPFGQWPSDLVQKVIPLLPPYLLSSDDNAQCVDLSQIIERRI